MDISLLVGLKNNLPYTQYFYETTRKLYATIEIVFVSYGSTDGTHDWLDQLSDTHVKYYYSDEHKTLSDTYNKCISLASKKYVAFLHNDMVLSNGFAEKILYDLTENRVLFYRVVEPPVFSEDLHKWKLTEDFGSDLQTFRLSAFQKYVADIEEQDSEPTEDLFFFLAVSKTVLTHINGLDPIFDPMFREDSDLLYRLQLLGLDMYQCYNAIAYHFVSKTSRFSEEYLNKTKEIEEKSDRNFYRKWGFGICSTVKEKRQYGLVLKNADTNALRLLEPFVSKIYTSSNTDGYVKSEQPFTSIDVAHKFAKNVAAPEDDILIYFNAKRISSTNLRKFETLSEIIKKKSASPWFNFKKNLFSKSSFKTGGLKIVIHRFKTYEQELIIRK
ncbi:MAG TPA: glycosyltransferase family 2 protein [Niabella sp.]|nr:glycosyltransferase family 2 protein [Niabella sp.]